MEAPETQGAGHDVDARQCISGETNVSAANAVTMGVWRVPMGFFVSAAESGVDAERAVGCRGERGVAEGKATIDSKRTPQFELGCGIILDVNASPLQLRLSMARIHRAAPNRAPCPTPHRFAPADLAACRPASRHDRAATSQRDYCAE
jgi:hypothetical protein